MTDISAMGPKEQQTTRLDLELDCYITEDHEQAPQKMTFKQTKERSSLEGRGVRRGLYISLL